MSDVQHEQRTDRSVEVGEIAELNGLSWEPWVLITNVDDEKATFAVIDEMDDDAIAPIPDSPYTKRLEETIGSRAPRVGVAFDVATDENIDKLTAPLHRFDHLNEPHIQGAPPAESEDA